MYVLYNDSGKVQLDLVSSKTASNYIIVLANKKLKIKFSKVFFELEDIEYFTNQDLIKETENINIDELWSYCIDNEIDLMNLAIKYYQDDINSKVKLAAVIKAVYDNPIYFHKISHNRIKGVRKDILEKIKKSLSIKAQKQKLLDQYVTSLLENNVPSIFFEKKIGILYLQDKELIEYQAVKKILNKENISLIDFALKFKLVESIEKYYIEEFYYSNLSFLNSKNYEVPYYKNLPILEKVGIEVYTIDGADTTEIDDGFSINKNNDDTITIGIHIAIPSIVCLLDNSILERIKYYQSSIYVPNYKFTMLPKNWINEFSLDEKTYKPCMSLYLIVDSNFTIKDFYSQINILYIKENLRLENLALLYDSIINKKNDTNDELLANLIYLHGFTTYYKKNRVENNNLYNNQIDYSFIVNSENKIEIKERIRGNPIDVIVSELSIIANSIWAQEVANKKIKSIFRYQSINLNKVQMGIKPNHHHGLDKKYYAWFSSPLRRSIDFYNQIQLICSLYKNYNDNLTKDKDLLDNIKNYFVKIRLYNDFQRKMLYFFSLSYLKQEKITRLETSLINNNYLFRAEKLPLYFKFENINNRNINIGDKVLFVINNIDLINLDIDLSLV